MVSPIAVKTGTFLCGVSFRLLMEEPRTTENHMMIATMLRLSLFYSIHPCWYFLYQQPRPDHQFGLGLPPDWDMPEQFDLLVDYLVWACEEADSLAIPDTLWVMACLRGSPTTLERKRNFIDMTLWSMERYIVIFHF